MPQPPFYSRGEKMGVEMCYFIYLYALLVYCFQWLSCLECRDSQNKKQDFQAFLWNLQSCTFLPKHHVLSRPMDPGKHKCLEHPGLNSAENSLRPLSAPCDSCYVMCISSLVWCLDVTVLVSHGDPCSLQRPPCLSSSLLHFSPPLIKHLLFSCSY